ncbi:MAG: xanthine phosphoribosyltransferase [Lachnospiraceae bacterium]|jgi:xanthine phosphoribosyltransferase|nr:xanthine phosphoribosyltransferase [Lachnospiraceae bacterium]
MKLLEDKILNEGIVLGQDILKVDGFINHQIDVSFMEELGKDMAEYFQGQGITKVFTIESSGIAPAVFTAKYLNVPMVILKKQASKNLKTQVWQTEVVSYTKDLSYELTLAKEYISDTDHILIVDDFLANGEAATGAVRLIRKAHATIAGVGVLIEKSFQPGREKLESQGISVYAQAQIRDFENGKVRF